MKKQVLRHVWLVAAAVALLVVGRVTRSYWVRAVYEGEVTDSSNGSKVELVEIHRNGRRTYTNFEGYFNFWKPGPISDIFVLTTAAFESQGGPVPCEIGERVSLAVDRYSCQVEIVPTAGTILTRALSSLEARPGEKTREWQLHLGSGWIYFHPEGQRLWSDSKEYVGLLTDREIILEYLNLQTERFKIDPEFELLEQWSDPVTGQTFKNVAEFEVTYFSTNATQRTQKEHLVRVDKNWAYLLPFTRQEILDFVAHYDWILEL